MRSTGESCTSLRSSNTAGCLQAGLEEGGHSRRAVDSRQRPGRLSLPLQPGTHLSSSAGAPSFSGPVLEVGPGAFPSLCGANGLVQTPPLTHASVFPPDETGAPGCAEAHREAAAERRFQSPPPHPILYPPSCLLEKSANLDRLLAPAPSSALTVPHLSVFPWPRSPLPGEPLWTGRVAEEPPESASVTAEAGKLPTFKVRPFCPFQMVESGLWEEDW